VLRKLWGLGGSLSNFIEMQSKKSKGSGWAQEEFSFFLFNDLLLYARPITSLGGPSAAWRNHSSTLKNRSYRYIHSFSWYSRSNVGNTFEVADIPDSEGTRNTPTQPESNSDCATFAQL
jgi:hypothetical protein